MDLHLFSRVSVFLKHITVGQAIQINGVRVHPRPRLSAPFSFQLSHGSLSSPRDALIGVYYATKNSPTFMQRLQAHHQLHGCAIGIGNDQIFGSQDITIHFRNDQFVVTRHSPRTAVIHHGRTKSCELGCPFQTQVSPSRKQSHIRLQCEGMFNGNDLDLGTLE